jgi:hypothetical protein
LASQYSENPLPIELINFKAFVSDGRVILSWSTVSEHNNSHFEIERSTNMEGFASLGRLNSKAPNGNSSQLLDYIYTDHNAVRGQNYYRLKQVDFDGNYAYSNIIAVSLDIVRYLFDAVSVYPNPTTGKLKLNIPSTEVNLRISLYNSNGALLVEYDFDPHQPYLDLGSYQNGIFLLKISSKEDYVIHRIVKQ